VVGCGSLRQAPSFADASEDKQDRLCLLIGKHTGILTYFQTKVNKKTAKKAPFLVILFPIEIRTISRIISLKCAEFLFIN